MSKIIIVFFQLFIAASYSMAGEVRDTTCTVFEIVNVRGKINKIKISTTVYDNTGRPLKIIKYSGGATESEENYYYNGNLLYKTELFVKGDKTTTGVLYFYYNNLLKEEIQVLEANYILKKNYHYDEKERLVRTEMKDFSKGQFDNSSYTDLLYNDSGKLIKEISFNGNDTSYKLEYFYDQNGKLKKETSYKGGLKEPDHIIYEYDTSGKLLISREYHAGNLFAKTIHSYNSTQITRVTRTNNNNNTILATEERYYSSAGELKKVIVEDRKDEKRKVILYNRKKIISEEIWLSGKLENRKEYVYYPASGSTE